MNYETSAVGLVAAPGTERPRRYLPKLRYELIGCGLHGHELLGTDAAELCPEDDLFAVNVTNLYLVGMAVAAYAVLEGAEAVGLWLGRRWAEYLTFIATVVFVPAEKGKDLTCSRQITSATGVTTMWWTRTATRSASSRRSTWTPAPTCRRSRR